MVWGCFGAGKVGDLYKVKEILNKEGYHSYHFSTPCGQRSIGPNFPLQQDNDPKHTFQTMQELFREEAVIRSQPY